jgi:hypothetical protein
LESLEKKPEIGLYQQNEKALSLKIKECLTFAFSFVNNFTNNSWKHFRFLFLATISSFYVHAASLKRGATDNDKVRVSFIAL